MAKKDIIEMVPANEDTQQSADEITFGGQHIAHVARYGNMLHVSLANGLQFKPTFPDDKIAASVHKQLQHAMDNSRIVTMGANTR